MVNEEKTFYIPGTICTVRHKEISPKPNMWVVDKITRTVYNKETGESDKIFVGMKCRWFDDQNVLREAVFATKDLELVK